MDLFLVDKWFVERTNVNQSESEFVGRTSERTKKNREKYIPFFI